MRRRTRLSLLPVALRGDAGRPRRLRREQQLVGLVGGTPLDAVTISGDVGTAPDVTWNSKMTVSDVQNTTLTKGDGDTVAEGRSRLGSDLGRQRLHREDRLQHLRPGRCAERHGRRATSARSWRTP